MTIKKKYEKGGYNFLDAKCIGRPCFQPGTYQHRGATAIGSRNTGDVSKCCMQRAYRGCPDGPDGQRVESCGCGGGSCLNCMGTGSILVIGVPAYDREVAAKRKSDGWRVAR